MAHSLGYKDKVTRETIQNPYIPNGMVQQIVNQNQSQQTYNNLLVNMQQMMDKGKEKSRRKRKRFLLWFILTNYIIKSERVINYG